MRCLMQAARARCSWGDRDTQGSSRPLSASAERIEALLSAAWFPDHVPLDGTGSERSS
jgi:hypothetical protein